MSIDLWLLSDGEVLPRLLLSSPCSAPIKDMHHVLPDACLRLGCKDLPGSTSPDSSVSWVSDAAVLYCTSARWGTAE